MSEGTPTLRLPSRTPALLLWHARTQPTLLVAFLRLFMIFCGSLLGCGHESDGIVKPMPDHTQKAACNVSSVFNASIATATA